MVKRAKSVKAPPPKDKSNKPKGSSPVSQSQSAAPAVPFPPVAPTPPAATVLTEMPPTFEELLSACVMARRNSTVYHASRQTMHMLLADPRGSLVEVNDDYKDAAGNPAFRASEFGEQVWSQLGLGSVAEQPVTSEPTPLQPEPTPIPTHTPTPTQVPQPAAPPKQRHYAPIPQLQVQAGIPVPNRGQGRQSRYGFEHLQPGESFFIGIGDDGVHPSKRIPGAVGAANKRLAPMRFIYRSVNEQVDGKIVPGVRVWRVDGTPYAG